MTHFFLELFDKLFNYLHRISMFLDHFLDVFDLQVHAELHGSEKAANYLADHFSGDMIELVIKVGLFNFDHSPIHVLHLIVAFFDDMVLAAFHHLNLLDLVD